MAKIEIGFTSNALNMQTTLTILMPDDIKKSERIDILYLLHGYMGNHSDWSRFTSLERYLFDKRLVVVMPSGYNGYYTNLSKPDSNFETYISTELPNYVERIFSFKVNQRFIAGLSMGGYGALKIGLTYPNRFHKIGAFSSALDIDKFRVVQPTRTLFFDEIFKQQITGTKHDVYGLIKKSKQAIQPLFITCGKKDYFYGDYLKLITELKNKQVAPTKLELDYDHEWAFWDLSIAAFLRWL